MTILIIAVHGSYHHVELYFLFEVELAIYSITVLPCQPGCIKWAGSVQLQECLQCGFYHTIPSQTVPAC